MNLHGIVSGAVRRVNPYTDALVYRSRGSTQQADYSRVPEYDDPVPVRVQKQAVTQADLRHLDNLNQQGVFATLYTDGNWAGLTVPGNRVEINLSLEMKRGWWLRYRKSGRTGRGLLYVFRCDPLRYGKRSLSGPR